MRMLTHQRGHSIPKPPLDRVIIDDMRRQPTVLLVSSNGAGMGHLTRLLAYARRLSPTARCVLLSLSQAAPVADSEGVSWEYVPSQGATGLRPSVWRRMFAERLGDALHLHDPDVLVFDGTHPYRGLDEALGSHPRTRAVWSRRGMWKPGRNEHQLAKASWFDAVLEPGDLARPADRGETAAAEPSYLVPPVTLVDRDQISSRTEARAALGLPLGGQLALVSLGSGNINDIKAEVGAAAAALHQRGIGVCVTSTAIAEHTHGSSETHLVRHFPLGEHFAAFDLAIAAAGYNSFHELLRFGIPTLFIPNDATSLDDQVARANYAAAQGWALSATTLADGSADDHLDELLRAGGAMASKAQAADPGNGAHIAAEAILEVGGIPQEGK